MLATLIDFSLRRRGFVAFLAVVLVVAGVWSAGRVAIDAVPDITSPQVQINTAVAALAPEEVETLVTVPIEREMAGLPGMTELRSLSKFGLSQITMTFRDGADLYLLRQLVTERLTQANAELPAGSVPVLAPVSTGLGEIVYYTVRYRPGAPGRPADSAEQLRQLRFIHDYQLKPLLRGTPGVAEVNAIGGYERQIVIEPDPKKLGDAAISFAQLVSVVRNSTEKPLLVRDVAAITIGSAVRTGASTLNGEESVTGAAIMLAGENSRRVARAVVEQLDRIRPKLPADVEIRVLYDRSDLVHATITTVGTNLAEGALLVAAILFALLGHWRAALVVTLAIPLSFLFLLTGMAQARLSANLMSLGAIDFGLIVDGAIVMVENFLRHLATRQHQLGRLLTKEERLATIRTAAHEVAHPMFFGVLIITFVYLPILALTGIEGKMFAPMALAVMLALAGALLLALTLMPVLSTWLLGGPIAEGENWFIRAAKAVYTPLLALALRHRGVVVAAAVALVAGAGWSFTRLGAEFIPQLDEGSITIQMIRGNSIGLAASVDLQRRSEQLLRARFPEIAHLFSRIGTAEIATDPMGPNVSDTYLQLQPLEKWRRENGRPITKARLVGLMRTELVTTVPGQTCLFSQPVQLRFNEIMAGARADLSLKLYGDDYAELERLAGLARDILRGIPGGGDVEFDALGRLPVLEVTPNRDALRRLNLHADEINAVIATALGGSEAGHLIEGSRPQEIVV
ncbi:MAG: efflux RND transporter permease subunit, partial [Opitutae bacterium]|nr:efflux RND transporter permease subunit [Opitutae bacterium]